MPTLEELLGVGGKTHEKIMRIDFNTRTINIPKDLLLLGVETDDDVKIATFKVGRNYYDNDLSQFDIFVYYVNANKEGDIYDVQKKDIRVTETTIEFDWLIGRRALVKEGNVVFSVCMKKIKKDEHGAPVTDEHNMIVVEKEFNTTIASLPVLQGLEISEEIFEEYSDLLMQWKQAIFGAGDGIIDGIKASGETTKQEIKQSLEQWSAGLSGQISAAAQNTIDVYITEKEQLFDTTLQEATQNAQTNIDTILSNGAETYFAAHPPIHHEWQGTTLKLTTLAEESLTNLQGEKGDKGDSPVITTSKSGKKTTVRIQTGADIKTFEVMDGSDGTGSGNMHTNTYDPTGKARDIFEYVDEVANVLVEALGIKVDKEDGKGLSERNYSLVDKTKVDNLPENTNSVLNGLSTAVQNVNSSLEDKVDKIVGRGLSEKNYTAVDQAKVAKIPADTNEALSNKVDKINGKGLSTNDFTTAYKSKLDNAPVNINNEFNKKMNKPTITPYTMTVSGWSGDTYSFVSTWPTATYDIEIFIGTTSTLDQVVAFNAALLVGGTDNVVKAYGTKPTIDIPILVKVVAK